MYDPQWVPDYSPSYIDWFIFGVLIILLISGVLVAIRRYKKGNKRVTRQEQRRR